MYNYVISMLCMSLKVQVEIVTGLYAHAQVGSGWLLPPLKC